jgi:hypothetical protein
MSGNGQMVAVAVAVEVAVYLEVLLTTVVLLSATGGGHYGSQFTVHSFAGWCSRRSAHIGGFHYGIRRLLISLGPL